MSPTPPVSPPNIWPVQLTHCENSAANELADKDPKAFAFNCSMSSSLPPASPFTSFPLSSDPILYTDWMHSPTRPRQLHREPDAVRGLPAGGRPALPRRRGHHGRRLVGVQGPVCVRVRREGTCGTDNVSTLPTCLAAMSVKTMLIWDLRQWCYYLAPAGHWPCGHGYVHFLQVHPGSVETG